MAWGLAATIAIPSAQAALGGPVILGGDDLTDHGSISGATLQNGWAYIRSALENLKPQVTRANDNTVAVIGSTDSLATAGNAGGAYHYAAPQAGLTPTFVEGSAAINAYFAGIQAGTNNPAIVVIAGNGAANNLDGGEIAAVNANAVKIADFVNSGGGLLSHGSSYTWLSTLIPGITFPFQCSTPLTRTAAGQAAFPTLTDAQISAGPCHNTFSGNLGGLQVLARDRFGLNAIIGGAAVQLPGTITLAPVSATGTTGGNHTVTATVKDNANAPVVGTTVTFLVTSGPNAGATGTGTTNASGQAPFTYTSNGVAGTDQIQASFVDATRTTRTSPAVQMTWEAPANTPPTVTAAGNTVDEGTASTVSGTVTDPDAGQGHTIEVHWNTGPVETINLAPGVLDFSASRVQADDTPVGTPSDTFILSVIVTDSLGATGSTTATVTVNNVAPAVSAGPDQTVFRNDAVSLSGSWSDPAGSLDDLYSWAWDTSGDGIDDATGTAGFGSTVPASTAFALEGTYNLRFSVTDNDTGAGADTVQITVLNRPPVCSAASPTRSSLWPPNHQLESIGVLGVTDAEGDTISLTIDSIRQDEPVNALGDGDAEPDGFGVGTATARVRAERAGTPRAPGDGRVYHIGFTATDGHGGSCSGVVKVGVPHDQRPGSSPVDGGPLYDSTIVS